VVPCYRFAHDGTEYVLGRMKRVRRHAFGSLAESSLQEIWESAPYLRFRRTLTENRYPSCPDCDLLEGCDMAADTTADCWSGTPSCADCLWARGFMRCP
jgi:radical SAM protein with 4Fe4S-binding SPASM domain